MEKLKHYTSAVLTGIVAMLLIGIAAFGLMLKHPLPIQSPGAVYEFQSGINVKGLARDLADKKIITHPNIFELYTRMRGLDRQLKAGEYYFPQGISTRGIIEKLATGDVLRHQLRVQEGWSIHQLTQAIRARNNIRHSLDFSNANWIEALTPEYSHPEGLFMPDTYYYTKNESDKNILKRMLDDQIKYLDAQWTQRDTQTPYANPYEALIVASIVEKEASIPDERQAIAGVLIRRLEQNMRLQMDPTVIYGMGENFEGNITKDDLKKPTPYNTYVIKGLPPTPIALPSRQSIHAALHPDEGTSLFFVAKGDGSHHFSDTLEEHNEAVVKYILKQAPDNKEETTS